MDDVLVVGAGPAGLAIAAALCGQGLRVAGLAPSPPDAPWANTYGIWADELEPLGLAYLLGRRWDNTAVYAQQHELVLGRSYGLFDNARLQEYLLAECARGGMVWHTGAAASVAHGQTASTVTARSGTQLAARLVVDAGGHKPALVRRPASDDVVDVGAKRHRTAFQAAYGIVGTFSQPPVRGDQLVLMDYRTEHLLPAERGGPPTFLYAMNLGEGRYFVEETSLAAAPAVSLRLLERRLHQRLAYMGVAVREVQHVERCLFPMNSPLPYLDQALLGYGGAASMVHPISGYQVGAALRHAPGVAVAIAGALGMNDATPAGVARAGWQALWPAERVRRRNLYLFGLASTLPLGEQQIQAFFSAFFRLPRQQWTGYLSDRLSTRELAGTMLNLFAQLPNSVRAVLAGAVGREHALLRRALLAAG